MTQPVRPVRARDKTATEGAGSYTISDTTIANFQTFTEALADADEIEYYVVEDGGSNWEVARGVWTESTKLLTRATIIASSNAGSAVVWIAGTKTMGVIIGPNLLNILGDVKAASTVTAVDLAVANWLGVLTRAYGRRAATGDAQTIEVPINILTTDATPTEMQIGAASISSNEDLDLIDDRLYVFDGLIGAWQYGGGSGSVGDCGAYRVEGAIKQVSGVTALVGSPTITVIGEDQAAWDVGVTADNTNDRLSIKCTGEANKNIHWHGRLIMQEIG